MKDLLPKLLDVVTVFAALGAIALGGAAYLNTADGQPGVVPKPVKVDDWEQYASGGHQIGGPEDAEVTVIEFGDYECPACRNVQPWVKRVLERYSDRVAFIYRHYPISYHMMALPAARAAECASRQGKFFEFHDLLYAESGWLARPDLGFPDIARRASVADSAAFDGCLRERGLVQAIVADRDAASAIGVKGTPNVLINGTLLAGLPDSTYLIEHIEKALRR